MTLQRRIAYIVYRLTFPNGKIYIGKDIGGRGHSLRYFGSWNNQIVEQDFSEDELRDFTVRKEVIFERDDKSEVTRMESELIRAHDASNPAVGYNRTHRKRPPSKAKKN